MTSKSETNATDCAILAPVAKKLPHVTELHGERLVDDYFWMRDRSDPDLIPHLEAENRFTEAYMQDTTALQETLYAEMRSRIKEADESVPARKGRWLYFSRTLEGKQYSEQVRRKDRPGSPEEIFLDVNALAEGTKFFEIGSMAVSPSGNFLAYTHDSKGFRQYTLVVKNLRTGEILATTAERVTSVAWAKDNKTLFYTTEDPTTKRSNQLYRHKVGCKQHHLIFEEKDEYFRIGVGKTRTGAFIYLSIGSHTTATASYIRADKPLSKFKEIMPRKPMVKYDFEDDGKNFYIVTNEDAKDYKLVKAPCRSPGRKNWQEILPHRPGVKIAGVDVFADYLVVYERENGLTKVRVQKLSTGDVHYVEFPEPLYEVGPGANHEYITDTLRLGYQSMVTPSTTFDYDLQTREQTVLKTQEVKGYEQEGYAFERIYATASDGTRVPISLVYKKDLVLDGSRPCHLYGYGSYGHTIPGGFSTVRLSLLNRGYIYAIAHIRGGGDLGEGWREDGKLKKKMNTFTDFVSCAAHLITHQYTKAERLTIEGGSAGGLLMGAVLNLNPELFKAAIVKVPFVDVINTMLDETLPLTVAEFEEWGNPKVAADYETIRAYSPYENIAPMNYPAVLVKSALEDSQVGYWEPSKYVARLRETKTDSNPLIFKMMLEAGGHGGHSGRFDALKDAAFDYAFLLKQVGLL